MVKKLFNKTLLQIFFILFFIVLVMLVSNVVMFRNSISGMNNQIRNNKKLMARSIINSFDRCFQEVNNTIFSVDELPYQEFDPGKHSNINLSNAYLIINSMAKLITQKYIEDIILFYSYSDLAITSDGTQKFQSIFEQKYRNEKYNPDFWKYYADAVHPLIFVPATYYTETISDGGKYQKECMAIIDNNQVGKRERNIIVFINKNKLLEHVNQQNMIEEASLTVLDQDRNVILSTGIRNDLKGLENEYFDLKDEKTIQKGRYEFYFVKSDYNSFIYVYKIPYNFNSTFDVMKINLIILLIALMLGISISAVFSVYLYKPIRSILHLIGGKDIENNQNKYKQIYNGIEKIKNENDVYRSRMSSAEDEIKRSVFSKMVDDIIYYKNLSGQIDTYFGLVFSSEKFFVISFYMERAEEAGDDQNIGLYTEDMEKLMFEIIRRKFVNSEVFYFGNMQFIALVGIKNTAKRNMILAVIQGLLDELEQTALGRYNIIASVSKLYSEVQECKSAYMDIKMCMAYRNIKSSQILIDAEMIDYRYEMYFPLYSIEKLTNFILSGNYDESINIINQIIDKNIENNISYFEFNTIISDIFINIISIMSYNGFDRSEIQSIKREFFDKIDNINNYEGMRSFLNRILVLASKKIYYEKRSKLNKEFIIQYIKLHYAENLYLENMAEVLDTSAKYFSSYFKKTFGINFVEYLNRVRISHAKEYLKNTDMQINELCEKVGFNEPKTFARTFKKYCGISPTEYRREYRS